MSRQKMGYIYPKVIKSILRGETPKISISMYMSEAERTGEIRKPGDTWTEDGKRWIMGDHGVKIQETIMDDARMPWFCPNCSNIMNKRLDTKFWWSQSMCFDCVIRRDTEMQIAGTFGEFQKKFVTDKIIGFLNDAKIEITKYMDNLSNKQNFIDEDGSLEEWVGDVDSVRDFLKSELAEIDKALEKTKTGE